MSEMVERVAVALYSEDDPEAWSEAVRIASRFPEEKHLQQNVDDVRAQARRAIAAMLIPREFTFCPDIEHAIFNEIIERALK